MIGFFRELKESLSALREAVSNLSVWKLTVNIKLEELQKEVRTLKHQVEEQDLIIEELKAKREFLSEDEVDYVKLVNAFSERNYERLASWVVLSDLAAKLSQDNLKTISSHINLSTLCVDYILPRVVESALTNATYHRLLSEASITAKKLVLAELTGNLLWDNKQEVFDAAAKELASDHFLEDHYPKLVKALAQELKKVFYLVPLAREVAKQPQIQDRAAYYLANIIHKALSPDNTTTFGD